MKVRVAPPEIDGETVVFRWEQSVPNPFQREDRFFFRYEGIDLASFSPLLFSEIFLALQLKVFAAYAEPVEVVFPEPVPRPTVDFWRTYHDAGLVEISPVAEVTAYDPWLANPVYQAHHPYAVFFGGGKDSMLAACTLAELYGAEQVVLVQYVGPLNPSRELERRLTDRQEGLMLQPARQQLGFTTQRVWTDYQAQFVRAGYHLRPHVELYTVGALPPLLAHRCSLETFSYTWNKYSLQREPDGEVRYHYPRSRPEVLAAQSLHYRRALGVDLTVTNLNLPFHNVNTFQMLAERYPAAFDNIVMCSLGRADERWCGRCWKCAIYALWGMAFDHVDRRFPYDAFFASSPYLDPILAYAESGVELSLFGNAPWQPFVATSSQYAGLCHALATLDLGRAAGPADLGREALANLALLQSLFGNRPFPNVELFARTAVERLDHEAVRRIARLAADHLAVVDDLPGPHLLGNDQVEYDFEAVMPTRIAEIAHLRG